MVRKKTSKPKVYSGKEKEMNNLLFRVLLTEVKAIHCDVDNQKYSVKSDNITIVINGTDYKVFISVDNLECGTKITYLTFDENFVKNMISMISKENSRLSNLLHKKIQNFELEFLTELSQLNQLNQL